MKTLHPDLFRSRSLRAAVRSYRKGDEGTASAHLDSFLRSMPEMDRLRVETVLPKRGASVRVMARLVNDEGEPYFLKVTKPTDEIRFFAEAAPLAATLKRHGVHIEIPEYAVQTLTQHCVVMRYHDFMLSDSPRNNPQQVATAIARLNSKTRNLRHLRSRSIQERRYGSLPRLARKTVFRRPILKSEQQLFSRTMHALWQYREAQAGTERIFCHGDVTWNNVFCRGDATYIIDFANYAFAHPGHDAARLYGGDEDRLDRVCHAYDAAFEGALSYSHLRLAVIYGHFLNRLKRAAKGENMDAFQTSLCRLELELARMAGSRLLT